MQELETRACDPIDAGSLRELADSAKIIALHTNRFRPAPEFNNGGDKVCLDCGEIIPALRAAIVDVTCCIECQKEQERTRLVRR